MNDELVTQVGDVDSNVQDMVNNPPVMNNGFDEGVEEFIIGVMKRVFAGEIDLMKPSSLIDQNAYALVSSEVKGKADMVATNFCSKLRQIRDLMQISGGDQLHIEPTYQAESLVEDLKYQKEIFEKEHGNLFVI